MGWVPWHKTDIGKWEQVQWKAAKMVVKLKHRMNEGWLRDLGLFSPNKTRHICVPFRYLMKGYRKGRNQLTERRWHKVEHW